MLVSRFASRFRKDSSTEMVRTNLAHRKSLSQKENRHRVYERNRHFGLKDVNIPLEGRELGNIHETSQDLSPEKASSKTRSVKMVLSDQRKQLLQKYKEEKQLQKLKEQREKAKRGVFKVGLYRPAAPGFLVTDQRGAKAEPEKAFPHTGRITRSKTKEYMEQTKIGSRNVPKATQSDQRQTSEKQPLDRERKVMQPVLFTSGKGTESAATQRAKLMARTVSSTTRKPVTRATNEKGSERMRPSGGRPAKKPEGKPDKVIPSKVERDEKHLDSQTRETSEMGPLGVFREVESLPATAPAQGKERKSFAPKHCVFQPPCGLKSYQVAPLSPRSANAFLTPNCDWNQLRPEVFSTTTQDKANEILVQQGLESLTDRSKDSNHASVKGVPCSEASEGQTSQPPHDVPYFRKILQSETDRLTSHCQEWEGKLDLDIPDEAKGLIRTTVGQTRLLIKERFRQFEGLVDNCEYKRGEKETTCTDLDGFWDMVSFQVDDVNQKFNNLIKLEASGWKDSNNPSKKVLRKKIVPGRTSKAKQDDDGRAAARSRLAAIKNAMKGRPQQEVQAHAAAPENTKEVDKIVFDAGFFRIESPVKSFSVLSSERRSQRFGTPLSASKVVPEGRAAGDLLRQKMPLKKPDPQSSKSEHVDRTFSDGLESRCHVEDTPCPGEQDSSDIEHDVNKINVKMDCFSVETNLPLPAGDANTNQKEAISAVEGASSAVTSQDLLMSNPETNTSSQSNTSQEEAEASQSVLLHKSLTSECHLLEPASAAPAPALGRRPDSQIAADSSPLEVTSFSSHHYDPEGNTRRALNLT
ncbi:disks large-associated protein 5 isoform 4 [Mus musculus]|uniref:disks large-associated protein 5 isoform 4 n=1 Tax=Mus musculus TaxID=10090 RepID=UPI0003D755C7|nr:disks large-associated protein 5 isoform 4 [Mus musculus]|eukprot:XP_006518896.1 PREDICTED: disks large-associated protein 5 isoform X1 [Mus musculus]